MKRAMTLAFTALLAATVMTVPATAQVQTEPGVARISLIHGDVSTQRGDSGDWSAAALNAPIVTGDKISTGDKSRAELQLDSGDILRLAERSEANIAGLSRTEIQVQMSRGLATYSVFKNTEANIEIDTPNASVHPSLREGSYRILVTGDDETEITVRKGDAEVATPQGRTHVEKGQTIRVRGTGNDTQYQILNASSKDDWDRWNNDRDNTIHNAQAWQHTNRYYVGSEDLDAYGRWENVPDYGSVWVPYVDAGWAPYRSGRWVWEPYWGWTWVSYDSWGWAPYHYGRWFLYRSSWVWWPGPVYSHGYGYRRHYRPVWAPAYVSFFGFGGGFGVSFGGGWGSVGWLPIGPCDRYYPWYGRYRSHYNVVNVTNITNIYNVRGGRHEGFEPLGRGTRYSNLRMINQDDRVRRGISSVAANDFGRGHAQVREVGRDDFRNGHLVAGNLPVVPGRESLRASDRGAAPSTIVNRGRPERFFGKNAPAAPKFDREASDVRTSIERSGKFTPIGGNDRGGMKPDARPVPGTNINARPVENNREAGNRGNQERNENWRGFGRRQNESTPRGTTPSASTPSAQAPERRQPANNEGWRRFGGDEGRRNTNSSVETPRSGGRGSEAAPADRGGRPAESGNREQWRRFENTTPANRGGNDSGARPAPREQVERPVTVQDSRGERPVGIRDQGADWRRGSSEVRSSEPSYSPRDNGVRNSAPARGDSGMRSEPEWRRPAERAPERQMSRPSLDMRQPVVTPRNSGPGPGEHRGGGSPGGGGGRPAPSRGEGPRGGGGGPNHRR